MWLRRADGCSQVTWQNEEAEERSPSDLAGKQSDSVPGRAKEAQTFYIVLQKLGRWDHRNMQLWLCLFIEGAARTCEFCVLQRPA